VEVSCHFGIGIVACHFQSLGNFFYRESRFVAFLFLEFSAKTIVLAKLYKTKTEKSLIKFSFSKKATKIWAIFLMVLTLT
jgi:hypothetical protein